MGNFSRIRHEIYLTIANVPKESMKLLPKFKIAFGCLAVIFIASMFLGSYPGRFIVKSLPILLMAFLSFKNLTGTVRYFMVFGFLFSAGGDIFLDLSRTQYFVYGLSSFAIAHIMYAIAFSIDIKRDRLRSIFAILIVLYTVIIAVVLLPYLGVLVIPVLVYIGLISVMGVTSALTNRQLTTVFVGALLFILSDSIIALTKFIYPSSWIAIMIIPTYYLAQYKIGFGMIENRR
jgi:uncharacterized membrane protein YhhN